MSKVHGNHQAVFTPAQRAEIKAEVKREVAAELPKIRDEFEHHGKHQRLHHPHHKGTARSGAAATGGGASTTATPTTSASPATSVSPTVGAAYTASGSSNPDGGIVNALAGADSNLDTLINSINGSMSAADLAKVQAQIQQAQEMISTLSNLLKDEHDMRMQMIGNIHS